MSYIPLGPTQIFFGLRFNQQELYKCSQRNINNFTLLVWKALGEFSSYTDEEKLDIIGYQVRKQTEQENKKLRIKSSI